MQPDLAVTGVEWSALDEPARAALRPLIDSGVLVTYRDECTNAVRLTFAAQSAPAESDRLREFMEANAEFLVWRERLHARASLWRLGGQPSELLLPEEETRTALRWKAERQAALSAVELAYIDESLKSQHGFGRATVPWNVAAERLTAAAAESAAPPLPPPAVPATPTAVAAAPAPAAVPAPVPVGRATPDPRPVQPAAKVPVVGRLLALAAVIILVVATGWVVLQFGGTGGPSPASAGGTPEDRARAALSLNQYAEAVQLYTQALNAGKPVLVQRAYAHRLAGNLPAAIADYDRAILSGTADDQVYSDAAYTAMLMNKPEQAIGYLTKGLHQSPSNARLYEARANAYMALKKYQTALSDYESALRIDQTSAAAQAGRVAALNNLRLPTGRADLLPRVYIQVASEVQRDEARRIQGTLRDLGYQAPGIEFVASRLRRNELRYVHAADRAQAERLALDLQKAGVLVTVVQVPGKNERPKHFELWFAPPGEGDKKTPPQYQRAL